MSQNNLQMPIFCVSIADYTKFPKKTQRKICQTRQGGILYDVSVSSYEKNLETETVKNIFCSYFFPDIDFSIYFSDVFSGIIVSIFSLSISDNINGFSLNKKYLPAKLS